ncbi:hypothetical protein [Acidiphilium sp. PM]|uniref:hypothetical protein n=1 Tax=Acidiphilium sp. PM TaxID=1043206 RepID=UPI00110FAE35|nr:hypothetical protein [Acidiphilium sp. PM]
MSKILRNILIFLTIYILTTTSSFSKETRIKITTFGAGTLGCASWDNSWDKNPQQIIIDTEWVSGFIVGGEALKQAYMNIKDNELTILKYSINNYCEKNPQKSILSAAFYFFNHNVYFNSR